MDTVRKEKPKRKGKPHRHPRWPIVLLILVIGVFVARHVSLTTSDSAPMIYPLALVLRSDWLWWAVIPFLAFAIAGIGLRYRGIARVLLIVAGIMLLSYAILGSRILWYEFSAMQHMTSASYDDRVYHIAEFRVENCNDGTCYEYALYACDSTGIQCRIDAYLRDASPFETSTPAFKTGGLNSAFYVDIDGYIYVIAEDGITAESAQPLHPVQPITSDNVSQIEALTALIKDDVGYAAFIPGTHRFITLSETDRTYLLTIYDIDNLSNPPTILESPEVISSPFIKVRRDFTNVFSSDGSWLAIGVDDQIHIWNLQSPSLETSLDSRASSGSITALVFTENGDYLYVNNANNVFAQWDMANESWNRIESYKGEWNNSIYNLTPSRDEKYLAGSVEAGVGIWETETGTLVQILPQENIFSMAFHPDEPLLYAINFDSRLLSWHTEDWSVADSANLNDSLILSEGVPQLIQIQFVADNMLLILGHDDFHFIDPMSQQEYLHLDTDVEPYKNDRIRYGWYIDKVSISSDNRYILTAHENGVVQFWGVSESSAAQTSGDSE